jgi:hypothetical protein
MTKYMWRIRDAGGGHWVRGSVEAAHALARKIITDEPEHPGNGQEVIVCKYAGIRRGQFYTDHFYRYRRGQEPVKVIEADGRRIEVPWEGGEDC